MPGYDPWWTMLDNEPHDLANLNPENRPHGSPAPGAEYAPMNTGLDVPQSEFTFGQQHFSPEFLQAMRFPMLHFPSVFTHMY